MTTSEFILQAKQVHGNLYDYSKTNLEERDEKGRVIIICPKHGEFKQMPYSHLQGHICKQCFYENLKFTTEDFINRAKLVHGDVYCYDKVDYKGYFEKVCIACPNHGDFFQTPDAHLHKCGCPHCNSSKLEIEIRDFLTEQGICFEEQKKFEWLGNLSLDFFLPQLNVAIECQGAQHFNAFEYFGGMERLIQTQLNDNKKLNLCQSKGIKLLYYSNLKIQYPYHVFEDTDELLKEIKHK